ncbi:hypothetical protein L211DRAFT_852721 [Terfezia boudieri ATCC MYA-4762]|uniref:Uncharacterized protein n=1 Tax=Terfezia boudieri ATCC MYA-4762 TaxID=1051890 RepID=A0A3N4LPW1_9PEZI|nr:hypothetical protein L211DRAFT_852721 [Terfezia boudieri ATCC MYA-4762]
MPEIENEILECIRVMHPGLQLFPSVLQNQFIDPPNKTMEDPVIDIESGILAAYLPNEADEPDAEVSLALPSPVTPHEGLAYIEGLLHFSLQATPTANITELQDVLNCEKKRIETLEIQCRHPYVQRRITDFLGPLRTPSSSSS